MLGVMGYRFDLIDSFCFLKISKNPEPQTSHLSEGLTLAIYSSLMELQTPETKYPKRQRLRSNKRRAKTHFPINKL